MKKKQLDVDLVRSEAAKITGEAGCFEAEILLASAIVGPEVRRVARFLGVKRGSHRFVHLEVIARTLRRNGIWSGDSVAGKPWFEKDGGIAFNMDVCVAKGWMEKVAG